MTTTLRDQLLHRIADLAHALTTAPRVPPAAADELEAAMDDVAAGRLDDARARLDAMVSA